MLRRMNLIAPVFTVSKTAVVPDVQTLCCVAASLRTCVSSSLKGNHYGTNASEEFGEFGFAQPSPLPWMLQNTGGQERRGNGEDSYRGAAAERQADERLAAPLGVLPPLLQPALSGSSSHFLHG